MGVKSMRGMCLINVRMFRAYQRNLCCMRKNMGIEAVPRKGVEGRFVELSGAPPSGMSGGLGPFAESAPGPGGRPIIDPVASSWTMCFSAPNELFVPKLGSVCIFTYPHKSLPRSWRFRGCRSLYAFFCPSTVGRE